MPTRPLNLASLSRGRDGSRNPGSRGANPIQEQFIPARLGSENHCPGPGHRSQPRLGRSRSEGSRTGNLRRLDCRCLAPPQLREEKQPENGPEAESFPDSAHRYTGLLSPAFTEGRWFPKVPSSARVLSLRSRSVFTILSDQLKARVKPNLSGQPKRDKTPETHKIDRTGITPVFLSSQRRAAAPRAPGKPTGTCREPDCTDSPLSRTRGRSGSCFLEGGEK